MVASARSTPTVHPDPTPTDAADTRLLTLLTRATTPAERLAGGWLAPVEPDAGAARFERWLQVVADGDHTRAGRILAERGLTPADWRRALADVRPTSTDPAEVAGVLPEWARIAIELLASARAGGAPDEPTSAWPSLGHVAGDGLPEWVDPDQPWQFYRGFAGWLEAAARLVAASAAPVSPDARQQVTLSLARRMLPVAGPHLMAEVQRRSRAGEPPLFTGDPAQDWLLLWEQLPVMARLLATVWRQWQQATMEVLARIEGDLPSLAPGTTVVGVQTGAGDQHGDGRGVTAVILDDGNRWFLKPRSAGPAPVVAALYAAVDAGAAPTWGLALPHSHTCGDYTWVREVRAGECRQESEVAAYFARAGAALGALQALGATDLHHENFIASAEQPVLVDLETAIGPGAGWRPDALPGGAASRDDAVCATAEPDGADPAAILADTPTATSMVTSPVDGPAGTASVDIGALAGPAERPTPYEVAGLVLTDEGPRLRRQRLPLATGSALPMLDGRRIGVGAYADHVVAGYAAARARLADIADPSALLTGAAGADVRFVARPTQVYVRLGQQALTAEALADGVSRELVLERVWRAFGTCPTALLTAEQTSLRDLDVPLFTVPLGGTSVISDRGVVIADALTGSPATEASRRLTRLRSDPAAGAVDVDNLRAALFAVDLAAVYAGSADPASPEATSDPPDPVRTLTTQALHVADGTTAWLGLDYDPSRHRWHHERLGPGLLGEAGIGLALVAAGALDAAPDTATDESATVALGTAALLTCAGRARRLRLGWTGADAFTGPAGTLYALARAASLTGDPQLLAAAEELIGHAVTASEQPAAGPVIDPVAGALLALRWLPPRSERDNAVDRLTAALAEAPLAATRDDDMPDRWWSAMPSTMAGRLLAAHVWQVTSVSDAVEPVVRAGTHDDSWRPADAAILALTGESLTPEEWHSRWWSRAASSHERLDCAHLAAVHLRLTGDDAWRAGLVEARGELRDQASRCKGEWFGDVIAPDTRNLSAVHGMAALALLGIAHHPSAPDARTFG